MSKQCSEERTAVFVYNCYRSKLIKKTLEIDATYSDSILSIGLRMIALRHYETYVRFKIISVKFYFITIFKIIWKLLQKTCELDH